MQPDVLCPIHNEAMQEKQGKWGSFYSHRTDDRNYPNGWCNGKSVGGPYQAPVTRQTQNPASSESKSSEVDWDKIAVGKVASNIVNALVAKGTPLADIDSRLDEIFKLAQKICKYTPDLPF